MKIFLLPISRDHYLFYSEGPESIVEAEKETASLREDFGGVRKWAERKYESLQAVLLKSESGVGLRMRRVWEWLQRRAGPDESLLRSLRGAEAIKLYHPSDLTKEAARTRWMSYLAGRRRHHTLWLILNGLITPATILLAPIPGPNILGYWFVYRAICHTLALLGMQRATAGEISTETFSADALNNTVDEDHWRRIAEAFELQGLEDFVKRAGAKQGSKSDQSTVAVS